MRWIALLVTLGLWAATWPQILPPEADLPPCHMMALISLAGIWTLGEFVKHRRLGMQMANPKYEIERLALPANYPDVSGLAGVLVDAVESGAAVSFVLPLSMSRAAKWWRDTITSLHPRGIVLVARDANNEIVGTVQLQPAWAPNQPHRAEVCKLIVHRRCRGAGLGRRLMEAIEQTAREAGFTLLTLDARADGTADRLYARLGWTRVGIIPHYAIDADCKGLHDTVIYYKELRGR